MSWQLLVPLVEKLIDVGVNYYNSDTTEHGIVAAESSVEPEVPGATVLLAVEYTGTDLEGDIREALDLIEGLTIKVLGVKPDGPG
jgi:hypothetical protein